MWREKKETNIILGFFGRVGEDPGNEVIILALVLARLIIAAWFPAVKMAAQRAEFVFCSNCC